MSYIEHTMYSKCTKERMKPSKLIPGLTVPDGEDFFCPRCGTKRDELEHGKAYQCKGCNLHLRRYGNGLQMSESEFRDR